LVKLNDGEVLNDLLGYDGLKIIQRPAMFNFSLDSTLLAHFVSIQKGTTQIVDLCTGNAPIPMFLSLRTEAKITGVELQEISYDLAQRSVALNKLNEQINICHADLKTIHQEIGTGIFDIVTCNPPYFKVGKDSNLNKNDELTIARHEVSVTLKDIILEASHLLKQGGRLGMVHRPDRLAEIFETFKEFGFEPKRLRFVYPRLSKESNSVLIEGVLGGRPGGLRLEPPLIVYKGDTGVQYTDEILKIFRLKEKVNNFS